MPRSGIRKRLPSYRVSRGFLSALETYFQTSVPGVIGEEVKHIAFEMRDRSGTGKTFSPDEICAPSFLNGTKEIRMSCETASLDIDLFLARKKESTTISFGYFDENAMEKALAVYHSLKRALRPYRAWNGYVYSLDLVGPILMSASPLFVIWSRPNESVTIYWLAGWLLFISFRFCTPFTEFDNQTKRVRRNALWFICSTVIVGSMIVLLKKNVGQ